MASRSTDQQATSRSDEESDSDRTSPDDSSRARDSRAALDGRSGSASTAADARIPVDDSDLQAVIDQYEHLLDRRTRELERVKQSHRSSAIARLRAFLRSWR